MALACGWTAGGRAAMSLRVRLADERDDIHDCGSKRDRPSYVGGSVAQLREHPALPSAHRHHRPPLGRRRNLHRQDARGPCWGSPVLRRRARGVGFGGDDVAQGEAGVSGSP
ncbi:hypothetical protein HNP02_007641 [Mycobacterium sp. AZCC_0083]|nr:hypothetical protein [Mycobacterium sp. AZCC_0083]